MVYRISRASDHWLVSCMSADEMENRASQWFFFSLFAIPKGGWKIFDSIVLQNVITMLTLHHYSASTESPSDCRLKLNLLLISLIELFNPCVHVINSVFRFKFPMIYDFFFFSVAMLHSTHTYMSSHRCIIKENHSIRIERKTAIYFVVFSTQIPMFHHI